ncbi:YdeI/OmpD-associated family protein [Candidatus Nomurabacteria bacterium]|nr:YdeI/OmpD-associated family protein [Candidatus Nomurabacteria bacterium]USN95018.1 MAG: YdeI/OmpD-associated family protein [Candidatus Nomurabacteria bacterium]
MTKISSGVAHKVPADLREAIVGDKKALSTWEDITPLARNEWICWVISVKKKETRIDHIRRAREDLADGKRRPCCWPGCTHRK